MTPHDKIKAALEFYQRKCETIETFDNTSEKTGGSGTEIIGGPATEALALLDTLPPVRVKKLVWKPSRDDRRDMEAKGPFGKYRIYAQGGVYWVKLGKNMRFDTHEQAKSAAEAHYQAKIAECLEIAPQPTPPNADLFNSAITSINVLLNNSKAHKADWKEEIFPAAKNIENILRELTGIKETKNG